LTVVRRQPCEDKWNDSTFRSIMQQLNRREIQR
jgi:hypothetical protein